MEDIETAVRRIIVEHLGVEPEKVTEEANFENDLGADSLDVVELTMAFEEELNIELSEDDVLESPNVGAVIAAIKQKVDAK